PRARKQRLIPSAIGGAGVSFDVWRQRKLPDGVDRGADVGSVIGPQTDDPSTEEVAFEHLAAQRTRSVKHHARARFQFLPGVHQCFPALGVGGESRLTPAEVRLNSDLTPTEL